MEKLKMRMEKGKEIIFESEDRESIISWTITALFDNAVKRNKVKVEQYYVDNTEYCRIIATYKRMNLDYKEEKEVYIIENWRNEWGNFINTYKTFEDNGIEVK